MSILFITANNKSITSEDIIIIINTANLKKRFNFYPLAIIIVLFSLMLTTLSTNAQTNGLEIWIDEIEVGTGAVGELTIAITANAGEPIGAVQTEVAYDSDAIEVINCTLVDFIGVCDISTSGIINLAAVQASGAQENAQLATIVVKAIGVDGDIISFIPTTDLIGNVAGELLLDYSDVEGSVTIETLYPTSISLSNSKTGSDFSFIPIGIILFLALILGTVFFRKQRKI